MRPITETEHAATVTAIHTAVAENANAKRIGDLLRGSVSAKQAKNLIKTVQKCVSDVLELRAEQDRTEASRVLEVLRFRNETPSGSLMAFPRTALPYAVDGVELPTLETVLSFLTDNTAQLAPDMAVSILKARVRYMNWPKVWIA